MHEEIAHRNALYNFVLLSLARFSEVDGEIPILPMILLRKFSDKKTIFDRLI